MPLDQYRMEWMGMRLLYSLFLAIVMVALAFNKASAQGYAISQIPSMGSNSTSIAVNNLGTVIGNYSDTSGISRGFIYSNGNMQDVGSLGGATTNLYSLNDAGQVAGFSQATDQSYHPIIYANGVIHDLGLIATGYGSALINSAGQVATYMNVSNNGFDPQIYLFSSNTITSLNGSFQAPMNIAAMAWNNNGQILVSGNSVDGALSGNWIFKNGVVTSIPKLCGTNCSAQAMSMNSSGDVVGYSSTVGGYMHAFLYSDGMLKDLLPQLRNSSATSINDQGQVIGNYNSVDGSKQHGFTYQNDQFLDLGTLGGSNSTVSSLNSSGQIVGTSQVWDSVFNTNGENHAFLYQNGKMFDLNSLVNPQSPLGLYVTLTSAQTITDSGYILAQGVDMRDFSDNYYLLAPPPVPIPATVWLLLSSVGGLGMFARKRKQA